MSRLVSHVTFRLHETYKGNKLIKVDVRPGWSEVNLTKLAWGYFDLPITVHFHKHLGIEPLVVDHELSFQGAGKWSQKSKTIDGKKVASIIN